MTATDSATGAAPSEVASTRTAIVGTGFAGLGLALRLLQQGKRDFVVFERADEVGGTWRDNTYPGCQCDVPSVLYSFSFAPNPEWSRTYSPQGEIYDYLRRCADETGVREHIRFDHEVTSAAWDAELQRWRIATSQGEWLAEVLVTAHGGLSAPAVPDIPGLERFTGKVFHSAHWDHDHDLTGERVAVVGTGASAIQIVPRIVKQVERLTLFQRTAPWVLPHTDRPTTAFERRVYRRFPTVQRAVRTLVYWLRELTFLAFARPSWLTRRVRRMAERHLERQIADPELRAKLTPDYEPGCKRLLLSNHYYPALQATNAEVVTAPIREITENGITTADGTDLVLDTIVLATGFNVTAHPVTELVIGADGRSLAEIWRERGMRAYLGTTVAGFPNLFMLTGPNTGLGHTSLLHMIESQLAYVLDALQVMDEQRIGVVEVRDDVLEAYNADLQRRMAKTVWTAGGCASWYLDEHGRNTTLWPDFTWRFRQRTHRFDVEAYEVTPATRSPRQAERVA